ncbi:MAG TPA: 3-deoxy-D-manno-octulosonic acid transferase [Acetobacteraceae bacterium]|nr:3-deoxy-D-manno-octulosonic acid transferase [Acetobacteraceae bacterium]
MPRLNPLRVTWAVVATAAAPGLRVLLRVRQARGKEVRGRLAERRGIDATPRPPGRLIWLHAASVGETVSILPVLPALAESAATILLTTGTVTSAKLLAQRLEPPLAGRVLHRFVPLDVPAWASRFLDHWRPDVAGFVESELWPNLLAACRERRIPTMLVNARLSERSLARWQRVPGLARHVLDGFACVQPRSETDAKRLRALGCCRMGEPGDLKLAAPPLPVDATELRRLRDLLAGQQVWFAASTHPGEETLILAVHAMLAADHPGLLTIIAPRHPERGASILAAGYRSRGDGPPREGVWVADTLGELGLWYRLAGIAFIGRSLLPPGGGQNPLEPARLGCAIAVGPHTGNFTDHVAMLRDAGALTVVASAAELARWVDGLLRDPARRQAMGEAAAAAVQRHGDLPGRTAAALIELLADAPDPQ